MSGYFIGAFVSSMISPRQIKKTGQIRTYAAYASIASTAILMQILFIEPPVWFVSRFLSGFCIAGIMIIVEGWLNSISSNENRGQIFSIHMGVVWGGLALGQGLFAIDVVNSKQTLTQCKSTPDNPHMNREYLTSILI